MVLEYCFQMFSFVPIAYVRTCAYNVYMRSNQMFHFPDSDTGYYDTEERFYAHDAEMEAAEERRYLEEIEASHGRELDGRLTLPSVNPETGCTAAEMDEDRMPEYFVEHEVYAAAQTESMGLHGKVA